MSQKTVIKELTESEENEKLRMIMISRKPHRCYPKNKHKHGNEDYMYLVFEPLWWYTQRLKEDEKLNCTKVLISTFEYFSERHFVGTRLDIKKPFEWVKYKDVQRMSIHLANGLNQMGIKKGDFLGVLCDIKLEYIVIYFACLYAGIVYVPIQSILTEEEHKYIFNHTTIKAVFVLDKFKSRVDKLLPECKTVEKVIGINTEEGVDTTYQKIIEIGENTKQKINPHFFKDDDLIAIIYTSGTTGFPKGIVFRHKAFLIELTRQNLTVPLVLHSFLPYSHISGLSDVMVAFFNGGRVTLLTNSEMKNVYEDFQTIRPTILSTIPRILNFVYNQFHLLSKEMPEHAVQKKLSTIFGDRLIEIVVGSAHCSNPVKKLIRKICKIPVYDGYGISEVGTVSFDYKKQEDCEYKLVDCPELGYFTTDKPHPRGELVVKNKLTDFLEYYNNEKKTKEKFDGDGFFYTGDIVEIRGNKIKLIDRKNNVLKLAQGEFVSLENIENTLSTSKHIEQILLCPTPLKTKLVGLVIPLDDKVGKEAILKDIVRIGKEKKLNPWELPRNIYLVKEKFSVTELKKKNRRKIMKQYEKELKSIFKDDEIGNLVSDILNIKDLDKNKTFKELGGDSLAGTRLIQEFKKQGKELKFEDLMNQPIKDIVGKISESTFGKKYVSIEKEKERFLLILKELKEIYKNGGGKKEGTKQNIFLTGCTGFIGQFILSELLIQFPKCNVYCLIRKESIMKLNFDNVRVKGVVGDLGKVKFGLPPETFNFLIEEIDVIVHCGAMVNHFLGLNDHYDINVRSAFDLLRISCGYKPIIYTSSLSVYPEYPPKDDIEKELHLHENGYGASKWVTDCLVSKYYPNSIVFRLTLVIGSRNSGVVNLKDWFNRIIQGIVDFKIAPSTNTDVPFDMMPVDYVSYLIVNAMKKKQFGKVFNVSYKNSTMKEITDFTKKYVEKEKKGELKMLPFPEWITEMEKRAKEKDHPIMPFIPRLKKTQRVGDSQFLPLDTNVMDNFMKNDKKFKGTCGKVTYENVKKYLDFMKNN